MLYPGLLNTWPYMSHFKAKIKRPVFQKNSAKYKRIGCCIMCYLDLFQLFFLLKYNVKSLPGKYQKYSNIRNIKMKPPVALIHKGEYEPIFVFKSQKPSKSFPT